MALPGPGEADPVEALEVWFTQFRAGRAPSVPWSRAVGFEPFDRAAATGRADAAHLLLRIAAFHYGRSIAEEGRLIRKYETMRPLTVRRFAREALFEMNAPGERLQKLFARVMNDAEAPLAERALAVDALGRLVTSYDGPTAVFPFAKLVAADTAPSVRAAALRVLGSFESPEAVPFLAGAALGEEEDLAFVAVRGIASIYRRSIDLVDRDAHGMVSGLRALLELAESRDVPTHLRIAAIETTAQWPRVESIDRLVALLARPLLGGSGFATDSLRLAVRRALEKMTGKTLHDGRPEAWLEWWATERAEFQLPNIPPDPTYDERYASSRFYDIPIRGRKVVFVLDASTSMLGERMARMKREMVKALDELPEESRFNVIFFHTGVHRMRQWMVEATPASIRSAKEFIGRQPAKGWTNLFGGLGAALGLKSVGSERFPRESLPDQIVLLSDGEPSIGRLRTLEDISEEIRRINRDGAIRIDTIAVGADSLLLRTLAAENDGVYRQVR